MSNERSLLGTSLAAETSFRQFFWNQGFKPEFLESLDTARRSTCATSATNLAHMAHAVSSLIRKSPVTPGGLSLFRRACRTRRHAGSKAVVAG